jgi:vancomycin permeability regulator SanA
MFTLAKAALASWILAALIVASMGIVARPEKSDLAVVLGNAVHTDGVPSKRLAARLDRALQCYEQAQCGTIFVSGGIDKQGTDEALAMRDYLVRRGVPVGGIVVDSLGVDTWATAKNAVAYMKNHDMSSAMVVTQYFHIPRATLAFKKNGVENVSGAAPRFFEARDIYSILREVPAIIWYGVRTDIAEHK